MEKVISKRDFLKITFGALGAGFVGLYGLSCKKNHRKKNFAPDITDVNKSFASNNGYVDFYEFKGYDFDGEIKFLYTKYNDENTEIREINKTDEENRLLSGGIPAAVKKEITQHNNVLEAIAEDNSGQRSLPFVIDFNIPERKSALENILGILDREGGYNNVLANESIAIDGYGRVNVPILIRRLDYQTVNQRGTGQSVIDYVGLGENLEEAFGWRDALSNSGYKTLFIVRGPMNEVNKLTAEFVRNGYL